MKKIILSLIISLFAFNLSAKKIKFAVDMTTHTISPNGIHLIGDFQVMAGYGTMDWDPGTLPLTQEGTSTVYSVILNLPAFQKYEFKFVNGNQTYEAEFVPDKSRVGYNFNDNRWVYLDSLANDTTYFGAIRFGENAPAGKFMIRYLVDLSNAGGVSPNGVHVGASYQAPGFSPSKTFMYSFGANIHEVIDYVNDSPAAHSYIFFNGNTAGDAETIPSSCSIAGKRNVLVTGDTVLVNVCFASCSSCVTGLADNAGKTNSLILYPNPSNDVVKISNVNGDELYAEIFDSQGKLVFSGMLSDNLLKTSGFDSGLYHVRMRSAGIIETQRLIITH